MIRTAIILGVVGLVIIAAVTFAGRIIDRTPGPYTGYRIDTVDEGGGRFCTVAHTPAGPLELGCAGGVAP